MKDYNHIYYLDFRDSLEDPLDDLGMVSQQLEQLSVIGKILFFKCPTLIFQKNTICVFVLQFLKVPSQKSDYSRNCFYTLKLP